MERRALAAAMRCFICSGSLISLVAGTSLVCWSPPNALHTEWSTDWDSRPCRVSNQPNYTRGHRHGFAVHPRRRCLITACVITVFLCKHSGSVYQIRTIVKSLWYDLPPPPSPPREFPAFCGGCVVVVGCVVL